MASIIKQIFFLVITLFLQIWEFSDCEFGQSTPKNIISKCTRSSKHGVIFVCPNNYVISGIWVTSGVSENHTCSTDINSCHGLSPVLLKERNDCYWRNRCSISLQGHLPIILADDENINCIGSFPDFVSFGTPTCTNREDIYDMCHQNSKPITSDHGLIKSHRSYPWNYRGSGNTCRLRFRNAPNSILMLRLVDFDVSDRDVLKVGSNRRFTCSMNNRRAYCFRMAKGYLDLSWKISRNQNTGRGFKIMFHVRKPEFYEKHLPGLDISPFEDSDYASVQERMSHKNESLQFSCPEHSVIYSPRLAIGVSKSRKYPQEKWNCTGSSPDLVLQKNECYWKRTCEIEWSTPLPMVTSVNQSCIGEIPNVIATEGFKCINEARIHDVCGDVSRENLVAFGIIRSHSSYPWNYQSPKHCRKKLRIGRNKYVNLIFKNFDIDAGNDVFQIWHRYRGISNQLTIALDIKNLVIFGGTLDIVFSSSSSSSTGKGFLILYHTFKKRNKRMEYRRRKRLVNQRRERKTFQRI